MDGVSVVALIAIVAFAIDRAVAALMFGLSFVGIATDLETSRTSTNGVGQRRNTSSCISSSPVLTLDSPQGPRRLRRRAEKKHKLLYFFFAGILAILVLLAQGDLRILAALGVGLGAPTTAALSFLNAELLDTVVTGIALIGGAERIAETSIQNMAGKPEEVEKEAPPPIEVTGRLTVEEAVLKKVVGQSTSG